jgi:RNA polymerase sigma-70 factor, ECF subfamily
MADELGSLLQRVATKDQTAFDELYKKSLSSLKSVAVGLLKNEEHVQDVLQDTYILLWNNAHSFDAERGNALSWMRAIVKYRAFEELKRKKRVGSHEVHQEYECAQDDAPDAPQLELVKHEILHDLSRRLSGLDEASHRSIVMAFYHGYSREEIADELNLPINTVKSKIRRGLMTVRDQMTIPHGISPPV